MSSSQLTTNTASTFAFGNPAGADTRGHLWRLFMTAFIGDTLVVFLSLGLASWLRFETTMERYGLSEAAMWIHWTDYARHIVFGTILFSLLMANFGLYTHARMLRFRHVMNILMKAGASWVIAYIALGALLRLEQDVSRIYVFMGGVLTFGALSSWRWVLHHFINRAVVRGKLHRRILFVGWSEHAAAFINAVTSDREHLYEIVGCVPSPQGRYTEAPPARVKKLGDYGNLENLFRRHGVDMVMMADMAVPNGEMTGLANLCEKEMVDFKIIPNCFQILVSGLHLETVSGVPVLGLSRLPLNSPFNLICKEFVDIVGGLFGLLCSLPLIALFGFLVYRESPGPIFYTQTRLGRHGKPFKIIKIRSMRLDAEAPGKVGWSTKEDPRRLKIGAFMRKMNIDELPQFWNVVKGDMSLVGPRPERPELIVDFKEAIPHYNARHNIKPGITGWAQVKGFRGDTCLKQRIRCDLYYIEQWSLFLDIQIMFMTLFSRKGAC